MGIYPPQIWLKPLVRRIDGSFGGGGLKFVNPLDLADILLRGLHRSGIVGDKAVISFDSLPKAKLANVSLKDASTEIDIVLYPKKVDALADRSLSPGRQVNLHNADGICAGNSEGVS